jgi:hypothetical protein
MTLDEDLAVLGLAIPWHRDSNILLVANGGQNVDRVYYTLGRSCIYVKDYLRRSISDLTKRAMGAKSTLYFVSKCQPRAGVSGLPPPASPNGQSDSREEESVDSGWKKPEDKCKIINRGQGVNKKRLRGFGAE